MSAPERMPPRIWVENHGCGQMHDGQGEVYVRKPPTDGTRLDCAEYIRADLVQALVDALRYYGEGTGDIGEYARDTLRAIGEGGE